MRWSTRWVGVLLVALSLGACSSGAPTNAPAGSAQATSAPPTQPAATAPTATASTGEATPPTVSPEARTLLFDTDVAADDLVALAFLVAAPHVDIAAITVSGTGEAHCAAGVDVVLRLLERLDAPEIAVACGRETPLAGTHEFPSEWRDHVDGGSGLDLPSTTRAPAAASAVEMIIEQSKQHTDLTVLATGPLTNLADALMTDSALADRLGPVYVMGGALHVPGNLVCCGAPEDNDVAEWNIYVDPHAANVVVDSGITPIFVSLDGTNQVPVTRDFAQRVMAAAGTAASKVLADLFDANPFMTEGSYFLWDPLAAELAAGYPVGSFSPAAIAVEEAEGPESGFTRPISGEPNIQYLSSVDPAVAEATLLLVLSGG